MTTVLAEITAVVRDVLSDGALSLTPGTRFEELAGWDPTDLVSIVAEAECRFNIQFELPEIDRLATVDDLVRMVTLKQALISAC
ncbi:MAG TPA: acyl carrier protein [Rhodopila sp.]|nr:acyl carrier protein [Rhodopila sp.]